MDFILLCFPVSIVYDIQNLGFQKHFGVIANIIKEQILVIKAYDHKVNCVDKYSEYH